LESSRNENKNLLADWPEVVTRRPSICSLAAKQQAKPKADTIYERRSHLSSFTGHSELRRLHNSFSDIVWATDLGEAGKHDTNPGRFPGESKSSRCL